MDDLAGFEIGHPLRLQHLFILKVELLHIVIRPLGG
jgi:hypothetical protein